MGVFRKFQNHTQRQSINSHDVNAHISRLAEREFDHRFTCTYVCFDEKLSNDPRV